MKYILMTFLSLRIFCLAENLSPSSPHNLQLTPIETAFNQIVSTVGREFDIIPVRAATNDHHGEYNGFLFVYSAPQQPNPKTLRLKALWAFNALLKTLQADPAFRKVLVPGFCFRDIELVILIRRDPETVDKFVGVSAQNGIIYDIYEGSNGDFVDRNPQEIELKKTPSRAV